MVSPVANTPNMISVKSLAARLMLTKSSIYRLLDEDPGFPRPIRLTGRRIAFLEPEVDAYIQARIDARDQHPKRAA